MLQHFIPQKWKRGGRFGPYVPLKSPIEGRHDDLPYPGSKRSSITNYIRLPSTRTIVVLLCLLMELFIGYVIGWWHAKANIKQRPHIPGVKPCIDDPHYRRTFGSEDGDWFFHAPIGETHYPAVPRYNVLLRSDALSELMASRQQSPLTPLFIPFTRNHKMLEQAVLSYIAAGWPRYEIIVLENTGTMDANPKGLLADDNPFYLNYDLLRQRYGVSILRTPTLLSFAQLQNYMISTAMSRGWDHYFWSHQDIAVMSNETAVPFKPFYGNIIESLARLKKAKGKKARWVGRFYAFDWLTLINVNQLVKVGAWDTFIPYYNTDCDWYERARLTGLTVEDDKAGLIFDLHKVIDEPEKRFFGMEAENDSPNSERFQGLRDLLSEIHANKSIPKAERNSWQSEFMGGKGDPWTYDPEGFQKAWWLTAERGRDIYKKKWDTSECSLISVGKKLQDAWVEPKPTE
ncbi:hypothetical protein H072_9682 [Dactylellina haptotyla CBS 200.50]|uniref:Uncharacterized protein n=1 Tax=Dactylellina haptotyla (strain CBS 200.50) TaxID=1284197 RepID=S8A6X7_DACHA|nr:hypothetical protein H072_9682 [Dactylellina haptotyla CBS 200.50]